MAAHCIVDGRTDPEASALGGCERAATEAGGLEPAERVAFPLGHGAATLAVIQVGDGPEGLQRTAGRPDRLKTTAEEIRPDKKVGVDQAEGIRGAPRHLGTDVERPAPVVGPR